MLAWLARRTAMKFTKVVLIGAIMISPISAFAGEANVTYGKFNDFTDVRPSNEARGGYHKRVEKQFTKHFQKLAEQLPEGYKLGIKVNDIDLAGDVRFGGANELRIVKPIYFPKIKFSYALTDANGKIVDKGDADLKDMSFMDKIRRGREEEFMHDKRIITDWFENELLPKVNNY